MVALLSPFRKVARLLTVVALAGLLAACGATNVAVPSVNSRSVVPVALLVPASNPQVGPSVARSLENAARLAAQDLQGVEIDLRVYDTAGNPELAARRAQEAVQDGAKVIIGPLFAEAAASAGVAVQNRNVNVLAFSNNPAVAGGNVFILGNTFQTTADRLVRYANAQGRGNIFIVHDLAFSDEAGDDLFPAQRFDFLIEALHTPGCPKEIHCRRSSLADPLADSLKMSFKVSISRAVFGAKGDTHCCRYADGWRTPDY